MILDGPDNSPATILLAHGAGAPMDSRSMNDCTKALVAVGFRVARFEFGYMAARRTGTRRPPPRAETLIPEYLAAIEALDVSAPLIIGGKSMGGRVASMISDDLYKSGRIAGLLCLGYPFHPPGKPTQLRTAHLAAIETPTLIVQGTRDEFGSEEEVSGYNLSHRIRMVWLQDGNHDLKPRKSISGFSTEEHLCSMANSVWRWHAAKAGT